MARRLWSRLGLAVLVLLAVILIAAAAAARRYDNFLTGMWAGNPGFLERAGLADFQLFLGPREGGGSRQGYLIMTDTAGSFVANQAIEVRVGGMMWSALGASLRARADVCRARRFAVEFDDEGAPPVPAQMRMAVSLLDGTLTLYDEEKVYAFLEKDYAATAAALAAYEAGGD